MKQLHCNVIEFHNSIGKHVTLVLNFKSSLSKQKMALFDIILYVTYTSRGMYFTCWMDIRVCVHMWQTIQNACSCLYLKNKWTDFEMFPLLFTPLSRFPSKFPFQLKCKNKQLKRRQISWELEILKYYIFNNVANKYKF